MRTYEIGVQIQVPAPRMATTTIQITTAAPTIKNKANEKRKTED